MNKITVILKECEDQYDGRKLKLLYEQLIIIRKNNHFEKHKEVIRDLIRLIVDYLLYGDMNEPDFFDLFCEYNFMNEFVFLATDSNCRDIHLEIINSVGMLILNLKSNKALYYMFSNNFINQIISKGNEIHDDDFLSYYINFIKSLSLKMDSTTIQFFFHKQINSFPLLESALKMYNHPDPMLKNVVRNIFLTISKLHYEPFFDYLCSLPSVTYFGNISCRLRDLTIALERIDSFEKFKLMQEDIIDDIIYIQDIFSLKIPKINYVLTNALMYYYVMPLIVGTLLSTTSMEITISLALYMIIVLMNYIKDENFLNALFFAVFSPTISKGVQNFMKTYPKEAKNYFFNWEQQKNQTYNSFQNYVTCHFSAPFLRSLIHMTDSKYTEVIDIVNKYENLQDKSPEYHPKHEKYVENITKDVLNFYSNSEINIMTMYHKNLSVATGVNCGLSTTDTSYCFIAKMRSMLRKMSSKTTSNFVTNDIRRIIYSFFNTKVDTLLIIVNLLLYIINHKENISYELLSQAKLLQTKQRIAYSQNNNSNQSIKKVKTVTESDNDNDNDDQFNNGYNNRVHSKTVMSIDLGMMQMNKNKINKIKVSLKDFVNYSGENDTEMLPNTFISPLFSILQIDYDQDLIVSLLKLMTPDSCLRSITLRLIAENIIDLTQSCIHKDHLVLIKKQLAFFINKILEIYQNHKSVAKKAFIIFETVWEEYKHNLPIQDMISNTFLIMPYSFYDQTDEIPSYFSIIEQEDNKTVFQNHLMGFMLLNDMLIKLDSIEEKDVLIKDRFPLGNSDLIIEREYNLIELTNEYYQCTIRATFNAEPKEYYIIINGNKIYLGIDSPKPKLINKNIVIKTKYFLSQIELQVSRSDPRTLLLYIFLQDGSIEKECIFKDVDLTIKVKRNLEEHIKSSKHKEQHRFEEYFLCMKERYQYNN